MKKIKFGTDGWRDIIAENYTFDNVNKLTKALCSYLIDNTENRKLVVGYDVRFRSNDFAYTVSEVASSYGFEVYLSESPTPTPVVSWNIKNLKACGGVVITASHNPYKYNGYKFKTSHGGSAHSEITKTIEDILYNSNFKQYDSKKNGSIVYFDPYPAYLKQINNLINLDLIRKSNICIYVDPMNGAGANYFSRILNTSNFNIKEINSNYDPLFNNRNPEPLSHNLKELSKIVSEDNSSLKIGLALDGDADRIGAISGNGEFINSHQIFAIILKHLYENKGLKGDVVKTFSVSRMIDRLCKLYNLKLYETPIGFKNIYSYMLTKDILIGGEESGGIGIKNHIPERDGILIGLMLAEIVSLYQNDLKDILKKIEDKIDFTHNYDRIDLHNIYNKEYIIKTLSKEFPEQINSVKVDRIENLDGLKFCFTDDSWILFRTSGTEPILRIYSESRTKKQLQQLLQTGKNLVEKLNL